MKTRWIYVAAVMCLLLLASGCTTGQAKGGIPAACTPTEFECSDCIDNDGDGKTDYEVDKKGRIKGDIDCDSPEDDSESPITCTPTTEVCDGIDNDCDQLVDEDLGVSTCGMGECEVTVLNCIDGVEQTCTPDAPSAETCNNKDDNCDGAIDNGLSQQCGVTNEGECEYGTQTCTLGAWSDCTGNIDPVVETCDSLDNDCNGIADEGCDCINGNTQACGSDVGECQSGIQTCSSGTWGACVGEILPMTEVCDGLDNDCNGQTDEIDCNMCNDMDFGMEYFIKSSVYGISYGTEYVYDDTCLGTDVLLEWYCSGTTAMSMNVTCSTFNITAGCSDGACI